MCVQKMLPSFINFRNGATTFEKLGVKSLLLCTMQMKHLSSSLSFGGLIFSKALTFSGSGLEVNTISNNFIPELPKTHFSGFKVRFAF